MTDYDTITRIASQSGSLRQKIEAELILKDRVEKYNRLLAIEEELGENAVYGID